MNHIKYMKRALQLAELGKNDVSPNPAVGAVLVKNNTIIGEGFHKRAGSPHAEIEAIESAVVSLKGSTLYTTLEPCCSVYPGKKQPPCTDRIIKEGISNVVISMKDPNSHVSGQGVSMLETAGLSVTTGILIKETTRLNKVFIKNMLEKLPYIHLKIAQTIDGNIATANGHSKWITDKDAREDVHRLRSEYDAILIGSNTAEMDDPLLTVRTGKKNPIHRIVLNSDLSLPLSLRMFKDLHENSSTICIDKNSEIDSMKKQRVLAQGIGIIEINCSENGLIPIKALLEQLFRQGICSIIVEGGSSVYTSFIKENLFDEVTFYIAPRISGKGKLAIGQLDIMSMKDSINLINPQIRTINDQIVLTAFRR